MPLSEVLTFVHNNNMHVYYEFEVQKACILFLTFIFVGLLYWKNKNWCTNSTDEAWNIDTKECNDDPTGLKMLFGFCCSFWGYKVNWFYFSYFFSLLLGILLLLVNVLTANIKSSELRPKIKPTMFNQVKLVGAQLVRSSVGDDGQCNTCYIVEGLVEWIPLHVSDGKL